MNPKCDRRPIMRLLKDHFKSLDDNITSDELNGFLNEATGLAVALDEPNATAFDKWRQALAAQGYPVWGITQERAAEIKARAAELKDLEVARMKDLPELLKKLKKDAPLVTAAELMKQAETKS